MEKGEITSLEGQHSAVETNRYIDGLKTEYVSNAAQSVSLGTRCWRTRARRARGRRRASRWANVYDIPVQVCITRRRQISTIEFTKSMLLST